MQTHTKNSKYDYLEGTYKLLVEQSRPHPNGDYNSFKNQHLFLYGYDDFVGVNKLIPMKEYVGFGEIVSSPIVERPNMPIYYYMTEFVYRNNIITEKYWRHSTCIVPNAGIRRYDVVEDTNLVLPVGIPPRGIPKALTVTHTEVALRRMQGLPPISYIRSDAYIDKFLYFPRQSYKFVVVTPTRVSNIYDTEIGDIELNEPRGEPWFESEQVCIVFDECFIPPPLESYEPTFDTRGLADEMLKREYESFSVCDVPNTSETNPIIIFTLEGNITCVFPII